MLAIYNPEGKVVGWRNKKFIYNDDRKLIAHIAGNGVFAGFNGHIGYFKDGYFVDKNGYPVAFIDGAKGGPTPVSPVLPVLSVPSAPPVPPVPPTPPLLTAMPAMSSSWSPQSWDGFLSKP
jgi:hypothetical protein